MSSRIKLNFFNKLFILLFLCINLFNPISTLITKEKNKESDTITSTNQISSDHHFKSSILHHLMEEKENSYNYLPSIDELNSNEPNSSTLIDSNDVIYTSLGIFTYCNNISQHYQIEKYRKKRTMYYQFSSLSDLDFKINISFNNCDIKQGKKGAYSCEIEKNTQGQLDIEIENQKEINEISFEFCFYFMINNSQYQIITSSNDVEYTFPIITDQEILILIPSKSKNNIVNGVLNFKFDYIKDLTIANLKYSCKTSSKESVNCWMDQLFKRNTLYNLHYSFNPNEKDDLIVSLNISNIKFIPHKNLRISHSTPVIEVTDIINNKSKNYTNRATKLPSPRYYHINIEDFRQKLGDKQLLIYGNQENLLYLCKGDLSDAYNQSNCIIGRMFPIETSDYKSITIIMYSDLQIDYFSLEILFLEPNGVGFIYLDYDKDDDDKDNNVKLSKRINIPLCNQTVYIIAKYPQNIKRVVYFENEYGKISPYYLSDMIVASEFVHNYFNDIIPNESNSIKKVYNDDGNFTDLYSLKCNCPFLTNMIIQSIEKETEIKIKQGEQKNVYLEGEKEYHLTIEEAVNDKLTIRMKLYTTYNDQTINITNKEETIILKKDESLELKISKEDTITLLSKEYNSLVNIIIPASSNSYIKVESDKMIIKKNQQTFLFNYDSSNQKNSSQLTISIIPPDLNKEYDITFYEDFRDSQYIHIPNENLITIKGIKKFIIKNPSNQYIDNSLSRNDINIESNFVLHFEQDATDFTIQKEYTIIQQGKQCNNNELYYLKNVENIVDFEKNSDMSKLFVQMSTCENKSNITISINGEVINSTINYSGKFYYFTTSNELIGGRAVITSPAVFKYSYYNSNEDLGELFNYGQFKINNYFINNNTLQLGFIPIVMSKPTEYKILFYKEKDLKKQIEEISNMESKNISKYLENECNLYNIIKEKSIENISGNFKVTPNDSFYQSPIITLNDKLKSSTKYQVTLIGKVLEGPPIEASYIPVVYEVDNNSWGMWFYIIITIAIIVLFIIISLLIIYFRKKRKARENIENIENKFDSKPLIGE